MSVNVGHIDATTTSLTVLRKGVVRLHNLQADSSVKAVFVNIFGGILKCDLLAQGMIAACKSNPPRVPIIVRLQGTNVEQGRKLLQESGLPLNTLKTLYFSLIHPHLLYSLPIYSCTTQKNIKKIFQLQKKAIRIVTKSNYNTPTLPLFASLKILPLEHLITLTCGQLIHSIIYKYSPITLHDTWVTNEQRGINQDLRDAHQLYVPFARTDHVKRLPFFSFPKLWNDLPDLKLTRNPITFKIALKWHLHNLVANPTTT